MRDEGQPQQLHSLPPGPQLWGIPARKIRGAAIQALMILTAILAGQRLARTIGIDSSLFRFGATLGVLLLEFFGILAIVLLVRAFRKG
jgi:hypothetical protein